MDFEENHLKQGVCTSEDYKNKINLSLKYIATIYKCILCKGEFNDPSAVLDHFKVNHLDTILVPITKLPNYQINLSLKYIITIYKCILCKGEFNDPSAVLDHLKINHLDTIIVSIAKQENMDEELLESNSKRNQEIKVKAVMEFHSKSRLLILILIF